MIEVILGIEAGFILATIAVALIKRAYRKGWILAWKEKRP